MLFVCCDGDKHDGHDFAEAAHTAGSVLTLACRMVNIDAPVLLVHDVATALAKLATEFRSRHRGATWIGITGSNGKTTTKELIAAACGAPSPAVHATRGNLNNHLGVPLTVLATPAGVTHAVIEMGANHPGEIAALAAIVHPDVGVISSIGPAHLEGFGDLAGVARAKGELFAALPHGSEAIVGITGLAGTCTLFGLDPQTVLNVLRERALDRNLTLVGSSTHPVEGEVLADGIELRTSAGTVRLPLLGAHNLTNAAIAFRAAVAAGVPAAQALAGLARMAPIAGRLATVALGTHRIIDDSYNANPASMLAGLGVLAKQSGHRVAVLGAMGELGAASIHGHTEVGQEAARLGLPLVVVGERAVPIVTAYRAAGGPQVEHVEDHVAAVAAILRHLEHGPTTVLVKASRSAGLDAVVRSLTSSAASIGGGAQ
jgi:UDP-N-acetylmuramoyl-tripeptide--D-alanyl-D-alanine ligase